MSGSRFPSLRARDITLAPPLPSPLVLLARERKEEREKKTDGGGGEKREYGRPNREKVGVGWATGGSLIGTSTRLAGGVHGLASLGWESYTASKYSVQHSSYLAFPAPFEIGGH